MTFCNMYHIVVPFPVNELVLSRFAAYLFKEGLKGGTVKNYMAAVRHAQISLGLGDPRMSDMPQLGYIIRGIKKATGGPPRTRLPITPDLLRVLRKSWSPWTDKNGAMLWEAACMCFFGFLRCGEVVIASDSNFDPEIHMSLEDIRVDSHVNPSYIEVNIKASKTDPFRQGVNGSNVQGFMPSKCNLALSSLTRGRTRPFFQVRGWKGIDKRTLCIFGKGCPEVWGCRCLVVRGP